MSEDKYVGMEKGQNPRRNLRASSRFSAGVSVSSGEGQKQMIKTDTVGQAMDELSALA